MNDNLKKTLLLLGEEYKNSIARGARHYMEVDLGKKAESLGFEDLKDTMRGTLAIIPLKHPVRGMKVRIDGRTFVNYGQFDSGIAVPGYVARESGLLFEPFEPNDSMVLNFS